MLALREWMLKGLLLPVLMGQGLQQPMVLVMEPPSRSEWEVGAQEGGHLS
jgi:hypothetical protein